MLLIVDFASGSPCQNSEKRTFFETRMGVDEVAAYSKAVTKQRIASICLALGWNSIGTLSMEVSLVARLLLLTLSMLQYPIFKYCFHHPLIIAAPDFTRLTDSLHPIIGG